MGIGAMRRAVPHHQSPGEGMGIQDNDGSAWVWRALYKRVVFYRAGPAGGAAAGDAGTGKTGDAPAYLGRRVVFRLQGFGTRGSSPGRQGFVETIGERRVSWLYSLSAYAKTNHPQAHDS